MNSMPGRPSPSTHLLESGIDDMVVVTRRPADDPRPATGRGMPWERARRYLPSIDSPDLRTWLQTADDEAVVVPAADWSAASETARSYRQICVPAREYNLFTTTLGRPAPAELR